MAEISWIKITVDMFDNRKIKQIRGLPEGNNIVLVWIMLLTIAGRCNAGGMIFLTENIAYTAESLARELDFEIPTIKLALDVLSRYGMIVCDADEFCITNWEEYQNIDGMEKVRAQNRLRKQAQRERERALLTASRDSHNAVTLCHATEEDIEEVIETDKEINISNTINSSKEQKEKKTNARGVFQEFAGDDKALADALKEFNAMRTLIKHPMTDGAKRRLVSKLHKFPREQWIAILHQSIDHSWQDIYELKGDEYNGNRQGKPVYSNGAPDTGGGKKFTVHYSNEA